MTKLNEALAHLAQATRLIQEAQGEPTAPPITVPPTTERAVVYGQDGYTDGGDPRGYSARGHARDYTDKIVGMHINVHTLPNTRYRCNGVVFITESVGLGKTICYVQGDPLDNHERIAFATGYGGGLTFDTVTPVQNDHEPLEIDLSGTKFKVPSLGPAAVFVLGDDGQPNSDVVANLGLPDGHHISVVIEYVARW